MTYQQDSTQNASQNGTVSWPHLTPIANQYATELISAGFTVYVDATPKTRASGEIIPASSFHYSRQVQIPGPVVTDGTPTPEVWGECFGTFNSHERYAREVPNENEPGTHAKYRPGYFEPPSHSMPLKPSRLNGSGLTFAESHISATEPLSVAAAEAVASPSNYGPYNAPPTAEATARANTGQPVPKRYYFGATLPNARPWGVDPQPSAHDHKDDAPRPAHYIPAHVVAGVVVPMPEGAGE